MLKKFAEDLKFYRNKTGKNLKEIAEETKIHSGILEKLENADFTFQPQLYIRAFIKEYAKSIGISPVKALKDYDLAQNGKYSSEVTPERVILDESVNELIVDKKLAEEKISAASEEAPVTEEYIEEVEKNIEQDEEEKAEADAKAEVEEKARIALQNKINEESKLIPDEDEISFTLPELAKEPEIKKSDLKIEDLKDQKVKSDKEKHKELKEKSGKKEKDPSSRSPQPLVTSQKKRTDEDIENKVMNFKPSEKTMITSVANDPKFATGEKYTPAIKSRSINSSVLKNILMGIVVLLVAAGLIALFKVLFVDGSNNTNEIKRQNFDDVVKENEKKILGKRSDEEIRDSIAKANEEAKKLAASTIPAIGDSITLDITATGSGWLSVVTDSIKYKFPEKVYFEKGDAEIWKAKNFFHLLTPNADLLEVKLNGRKLAFDKKDYKYLKINKSGIIK